MDQRATGHRLAAAAATATDTPAEGAARLNRGAIGWAMFEGARNPYVIIVTTFIFIPYVSTGMVGDPVRGQALIAQFQQYAGWIVMATAPLLGASIDRLGPRKPWLALVVAAMVPLIACLCWAKADRTGLSIGATLGIAMLVNVLFSWSEVLHNSMLVRAAGLKRAHAASGLALALGNLASLLALAFIAWAFALPGTVTWPWVPAHPLFGLDPAAFEPQRAAPLLVAAILAVGALPLFLFTPDAPRTRESVWRAFRQGAADLRGMIVTVRRFRDAAVYLGARMFFLDGMNGVLFFFGVLAAGVMKWGALDLLITGIVLSIVAVCGGFVGRWLDAVVGPKNALRVEIAMAILSLTALLGMSPNRILYWWPYDAAAHRPLWNGPVYRQWPDVVFLLIGFVNATFITAQYASARTALTRLTPPAQSGAFFGIYALSGVATAWLAPLLVNIGTRVTHSQQGGFASIIGLMAVGWVGLAFVRGAGREGA